MYWCRFDALAASLSNSGDSKSRSQFSVPQLASCADVTEQPIEVAANAGVQLSVNDNSTTELPYVGGNSSGDIPSDSGVSKVPSVSDMGKVEVPSTKSACNAEVSKANVPDFTSAKVHVNGVSSSLIAMRKYPLSPISRISRYPPFAVMSSPLSIMLANLRSPQSETPLPVMSSVPLPPLMGMLRFAVMNPPLSVMMDVMMMMMMNGESNGEEKSYKERDDGYATNCDDNDSSRDENDASDTDGYFSDEEGVDEGDGVSDLGNYYGNNEANEVDESSGFSSMKRDANYSDNECDDKHDDSEEKEASLCMKRCVFNNFRCFPFV